jgi:hypothetical protein
MTGLGTRHTSPMLLSAPSSLAMAKPCRGSSQTRHSASHSASESDGSGDAGTVQGYGAAGGGWPPDVRVPPSPGR